VLKNKIQLLRATLRDRSGIAAMEYGILAAIIIGIIVVALGTLGGDISTLLADVGGALTTEGAKVGG